MGHDSTKMNAPRRIVGSVLATLGFLLSPLSWWNDLIFNIPLAYLLASLANLLVPGYFSMFMVLAYWLTNIAGLVLMHRGGALAFGDSRQRYNVRAVLKDLAISALYSVVIAFLVITNLLQLPSAYFH